MSEQDLIKRAHGDTVETLYKVFFNEFTMAHGDDNSEKAAKERFRKGILHARHVLELALALVP